MEDFRLGSTIRKACAVVDRTEWTFVSCVFKIHNFNTTLGNYRICTISSDEHANQAIYTTANSYHLERLEDFVSVKCKEHSNGTENSNALSLEDLQSQLSVAPQLTSGLLKNDKISCDCVSDGRSPILNNPA